MDPRYLLMIRVTPPLSLGLYYMATHLSAGHGFPTAAMLRVYQVAGLAFIFIPSNVLCYAGVPREKNNQIASMMNFVRNIGGSIGIAVISTLVTRATQRRQNYIRRTCSTGIRDSARWSSGMAATLHSQGMSAADATHQAYARMDIHDAAAGVRRWRYRDVVSLLAVVVACLIPLAFIMQKPAAAVRDAPPPH